MAKPRAIVCQFGPCTEVKIFINNKCILNVLNYCLFKLEIAVLLPNRNTVIISVLSCDRAIDSWLGNRIFYCLVLFHVLTL